MAENCIEGLHNFDFASPSFLEQVQFRLTAEESLHPKLTKFDCTSFPIFLE